MRELVKPLETAHIPLQTYEHHGLNITQSKNDHKHNNATDESTPKCDKKEWQQKTTTKNHRDTHETYTIDKHNLPWQQPHKPPTQTTQPMTTTGNKPRSFLHRQIKIKNQPKPPKTTWTKRTRKRPNKIFQSIFFWRANTFQRIGPIITNFG